MKQTDSSLFLFSVFFLVEFLTSHCLFVTFTFINMHKSPYFLQNVGHHTNSVYQDLNRATVIQT